VNYSVSAYTDKLSSISRINVPCVALSAIQAMPIRRSRRRAIKRNHYVSVLDVQDHELVIPVLPRSREAECGRTNREAFIGGSRGWNWVDIYGV
jgi:hypothetical protein